MLRDIGSAENAIGCATRKGGSKQRSLQEGGKKYEFLPHIVDHDLRLGIVLLEAIANWMDGSW